MKTVLRLLILSLFITTCSNSIAQSISLRATSTAATATSTTLTITKPVGLAVGDMMIAIINQSDNDNQTLADATKTGWTKISASKFYTTGSDEWWGTVLYKFAIASDVSATSFDFTLDNDNDDALGTITSFSGVDSNNPFDVASGSTLNSNNGSISATSLTTVTSNSAILLVGFVANNTNISNWNTTSPGALTEIIDAVNNTSNLDLGIGAAWNSKSTIGATGAGTATVNEQTGSVLIALRPLCISPVFTALPEDTSKVNISQVYTTYSGKSSYVWTIPGIEGTDYTLVSGGTSSSNSATIQWKTIGVKQVKVNYSTTTGCSSFTPDSASTYAYNNVRYAVATANWNLTSSWSATSAGSSGASIPVAGDIAYIGEGSTSRAITIPTGYTAGVGQLIIGTQSANTDGDLTFASSFFSSPLMSFSKSSSLLSTRLSSISSILGALFHLLAC